MIAAVIAAPVCSEDILIDDGSGRRLFVRRKKVGSEHRRAAEAVIFVHGATFPGTAAYDAALPGGSWLDFAAQRGCDAYALDIRGYGRSWRPPELQRSRRRSPPVVHTADAIEDLAHVVRAVRERTGVSQVHLVGWSWGTSIAAGYAVRAVSEVRSLTLFAPVWLMRDPLGIALAHSPLFPFAWPYPFVAESKMLIGAYRTVNAEQAWQRWFRGIEPELAEELLPRTQFDLWWRDLVQLDAVGAAFDPPVVRAPNGVLSDLLRCWASGRPTWRPQELRVPTLVILGEWDVDTPPSMAQELFGALVSTPYKRLEVLARGTHAMCLETNRFDLFERVQRFIESTVA